MKYHTFQLIYHTFPLCPYSWEDELFNALVIPSPDSFSLHFPYNVLQINYFKCLIYSRNLNVKNCQNFLPTDRPTNLPLEAPSRSLKKKLYVDATDLWENARRHIWKFLGQDEWRTSDGSTEYM